MGNTLRRIAWLFLLLGIGLLAGAGYAGSRVAAFVRSAAEAPGTVTELLASRSRDSDGREHGTYRPVVEYRLPSGEARSFVSSMGSSPPSHRVGEPVTVLYDPASPEDVRLGGVFSLWGVAIVLGGIGAVFGGIGAGILAVERAARRRAEELRLHGRRVQARFQSVERNTSLRVNGTHPWRIVCQWQDPSTGLLHLFKSENLWFDPTPHVHVQEITVFVDPRNPRRHAMDLGFLPRLAA